MTFFTDTSKLGGNPFEPKRQFRWIISFSSIGTDANFMAKTAKKPGIAQEPQEHHFMNHVFKYPGKVKWDPIDVTFIDSFQANMGSRFYNIMRGSGYKQPEGFGDSLTGFTKAQMVQAMGDVTIRQLDGGSVESGSPDTMSLDPDPAFYAGKIREEWKLFNAQLTSVKWGETLSYGEAGLVEVVVGLAYDYATYTEYPAGLAYGVGT